MASDVKTVLIVDDSSVSRMMVQNHISDQMPDWQFVHARSGVDALEKLKTVTPDLVTLDLNMPEMDGLEAAQRIAEVCPTAKIAIVTANIQDSMRRKLQGLGIFFVAVVEKPINEAGVRKILFGM
ncbi:hypothetical protein JCM19000A_22330 [Silvimonas sp. JCM 19000]